MMKWIGAVFLFAATSFWGFSKAERLIRQCAAVNELRYGLEMLETEILYGQTPLAPALSRAGAALTLCRPLFMGVSGRLDQNRSAPVAEIWENEIGRLLAQGILGPETADSLICFGQGLGDSDRPSQQRLFALVKGQLGMYEEKLQAVRRQNEKMWKFMGMGIGCALIILFL
jgi:stage III sporulation protein AB